MNKKIGLGLFLVSVFALGLVMAGCDAIGPSDTTTTTHAVATTTTAAATTTTTAAATTTSTTTNTTTTTMLFQISGTILQNECTFETASVGLMTWPSQSAIVSISQVTFVSGEANYIAGTNEAGTYVLIAAEPFEYSKYVGTVGSTTGEMSAITWNPYTVVAGVPMVITAPTFEMYTLVIP